MFLGLLESWESQLLGRCLTLWMWPVFVLQFNCGFLSNHRVGDLYVILLFLHQFFAIIYVIGCVGKLGITAFRRMFHIANVASIGVTIRFRVFEQWCSCATSDNFTILFIPPQILSESGNSDRIRRNCLEFRNSAGIRRNQPESTGIDLYFSIKGIIPSFLTHPRTQIMAKNWWRNKRITYRSPTLW